MNNTGTRNKNRSSILNKQNVFLWISWMLSFLFADYLQQIYNRLEVNEQQKSLLREAHLFFFTESAATILTANIQLAFVSQTCLF